MGWLFEWWSDLDWRIRFVPPLILIAISTILIICGILRPWGWVVGVVLLLFSGPSDSEKKGYRF